MITRQASREDAPLAAELACLLWPSHPFDEMLKEMTGFIADPGAAIFLACEGDTALGFAQCQLRHDYVEGTDSSPVGYLEGIFVRDGYRKSGVARALLGACEDWARTQGCNEFASDCELDNIESLRFHLACGFEEASRNIHFTKTL